MQVPRETPADLAERYRQLRPFDLAETSLVAALVRRPNRLGRPEEHLLRLALNLARLWVLDDKGRGPPLLFGPELAAFRERLRPLADAIAGAKELDPGTLGGDVRAMEGQIREARQKLVARTAGRLPSAALDRELTQKALVLVLGGGGGAGYVHLGALSLLAELGIRPQLLAGSSLGSVLGLFRARDGDYRDSTVDAVTSGLSFRQLFKVFEPDTRYGLPATLRLYLRSTFARYFVSARGDTIRLGELKIPFLCVVTGVRREAVRRDLGDLERAFTKQFRQGAFGALLHLKDLVTSWTRVISNLAQEEGAMRSIALGLDPESGGFDALDAVGFSCAVPALIHYDITRDDARMHELMASVLAKNDVDSLVDGGISSNVPARHAWECVQRGRIGTRNAFVLGLDCFAPQLNRHLLFLPMMRIASENVAKDRPFAHHIMSYRRVLSPAALVPGSKHLHGAIRHGREELRELAPFLQKFMEPLPPV